MFRWRHISIDGGNLPPAYQKAARSYIADLLRTIDSYGTTQLFSVANVMGPV